MNSFKKLLEEEEQKFASSPARLEADLRGSMRTLRHAGDMSDLYIGKVVHVLIRFAGGKPAPIEDPRGENKPPEAPSGPGGSH